MKILAIVTLLSLNALLCMQKVPSCVVQKIADDRCLLMCALGSLEIQHETKVFEIDTPEKRAASLTAFKKLWLDETKLLGNPGMPCSIPGVPSRLHFKFKSHMANAQINSLWLAQWLRKTGRNVISFPELTNIVVEQFPE